MIDSSLNSIVQGIIAFQLRSEIKSAENQTSSMTFNLIKNIQSTH